MAEGRDGRRPKSYRETGQTSHLSQASNRKAQTASVKTRHLRGSEEYFLLIRQAIDRDEKKYQEICQKNRKNIIGRWHNKRDAKHTTEYDRIGSDTKHTDIRCLKCAFSSKNLFPK